MKVKVAILQDEVAIVAVDGELNVINEEYELFAREMMAYSKMGIYRYVFDLTQATLLGSSAAGLIIRLSINALKNNSKICVICPNRSMRKVFEITNVSDYIEFVSNTDEGIRFYELTTDFLRN